jgi:hypothetical protein
MSNKTQSKAAAKATKQTIPAALPAVNVKVLHTLITADYRAMQGELKAGVTVYSAFRAVVEAAPLNDAKALTSMLQDMKLVFTDEHVDKFSIRATIINNARRVVHGGTKDKHVIQGRGRQALIEALDSVSSLRDLRKAMSEAKPEALKEVKSAPDARAKASSKAKADKKPADAGILPANRLDAFKAACAVLKAIENFFNPSQAAQLQLIEQTISMLTSQSVVDVKVAKAA